MSRTVLIAGATGMMGRKIAAALQIHGIKPRLMVRGGAAHPKTATLASLVAQGAVVVDADVSDPQSLERAVNGVDVIVSALQGGPEVIVAGQRSLSEAGLKAGVERIFPSDFSVDFRRIDDEEHLFLGWRRQGDAAIAAVGLPQTNTFNGAFTDMLMEPFLGLIDWRKDQVAFWGDADQPYDFTTTDDTAAYVAAASLDPNAPVGGFEIIGETASPNQLAAIAGRVTGRPFALHQLGSLDDLDTEIARRQQSAPDDPMVWAGLQYHRVMATGRGKIHAPQNARYPDVRPESIAGFLNRVMARSDG